MSTDTDRRELQRKLAADPDDQRSAHKLARLESRIGEGRLAFLRRFCGQFIYLEGARMNYLGTLMDVTGSPSGDPSELLFSRLQRVGDWGREGPDESRTMELPASEDHPQVVPWHSVDQFGLAPGGWAFVPGLE